MWETIKKILQKQGGTCIIIEEGKPEYVVTSFKDFQKMVEEEDFSARETKRIFSEQEILEKINQEITNWKTAQAQQEAAQELEESESSEDMKIENLPV